VFQRVSDLSGGERLRAALARGLLSAQQPELLVLDEPTNNLDLVNVEFLEQVVGAFRAALIVISHDEEFLKNCRISQELIVVGRT
jgi:ATPase subunit of ABC transporter with duplicated ATPase domains